MNRDIYRLVFNEERKAWIAVAEIVRGRGKKSSRRRIAAVALGLAVAGITVAQAGPTPPAATALPVPSSGAKPFVFSGAVTGGQPTTVGNTMTIDTASRTLGLNWASFNIGSSATVTFNQPDATSRVLNRIWSNDPSQIMGRLNANGQVYLINQNGILFGNGAQVNVGGLVASALNLSESMASRLLNNGLPTVRGDSLEFAWDGSAAGFNNGFVTVEAGAAIRTPSGGRVVLIAPKTVENLGLIEGGAGAEAILAAGGKVILTAPDDPSLRGLLVETQSFVGTDALGNSVRLDGSVTNKSDGVAGSDNGRIKVGAGGTVSLAALAVNQQGFVNATKAVNLNGTTILVGARRTDPDTGATSAWGATETDRLTINQRGDKAEIDWVSGFDVGASKTVEFVQSSTGAVAYNYVHDADRIATDGGALDLAGRSHIDGTLKANGQLLLINEKGFDFGATARVSASNFVASALGINPEMVASGLLLQDGVNARAFYFSKDQWIAATPSAEVVQAVKDQLLLENPLLPEALLQARAEEQGRELLVTPPAELVEKFREQLLATNPWLTDSLLLAMAGAKARESLVTPSSAQVQDARIQLLADNPALADTLLQARSEQKSWENAFVAKRDEALTSFRDARINLAGGAQITTAKNGFAILAGGQVNQGGVITTPGGQTVLAAGADIFLKPAYGAALRGFSPEVNPLNVMRGWENNTFRAVSRGADANSVTNTGSIAASLGNITLVGHEINQAGSLTATTSAIANGSIRLLARDQIALTDEGRPFFDLARQRNLDANGIAPFVATDTYNSGDTANQPLFHTGRVGGTLTLAAGSTTQVTLDGRDGKTLTADQTFISSSVEAAARQIVVAGTASAVAGAVVEAKGGRIEFRASKSFDETTFAAGDALPVPQTASAPAGVGIFVGDGARVDASGAIAQKSAADLFVEVELRGDEFANNPVQRNGKLRGEKAWVDVRAEVAIADLGGWTGKVGQTVAERSATGGNISLRSSGSVVVKEGAGLDVSGGQVNYAAGSVQESRAVALSGQSYRLKDAPVAATYAGLATVTREEAAYTEGKSAGKVELIGHSLAVDGNLVATTTVGTRQRNVGNPAADRYAIPLGGQLIVKDAGQHFALANPDTASEAEKLAAFSQAQIAFVKGAATAAVGLAAGDTAGPRLELSQSLVDGGFSRFDLTSDGRIDIPAEVTLDLAAGGSFKATGRQVYVAGDISAPGGSISLSTRDMSSLLGDFPRLADARHSTLILADGASLSTSGRWLNDFLDGRTTVSTKAINGGSISLVSAYDLDLQSGSSVAVSGGGLVKIDGKLESGNAGSITLTTGGVEKTGFEFVDDNQLRDASLFLGGTLSAYALGKGGSLAINTSAIRFGAPFAADSRNWSRDERLAPAGQVGAAFDADFLNRGGFYNFSFVGRDGVTVSDGVRLAPTPTNWSLARVADYRYRATGSQLGTFAQSSVLHSDLRSAPTNIALATRSLNYGDLRVGDNAYIGVSPQGSISLESQAQLTVLGTLEAPAGTISLTRPANRNLNPFNDAPINYTAAKQSESIYLGPDSKLLAGGTTVLAAATRAALEGGVSADLLRSQNRYKGSVLDGGTVNINAGMGYLITRTGSSIDVSGATDSLNSATSQGMGVGYPLQTLGSAGGSVSLAAREGMFLDGDYKATGGANALGGTFALRFTDALDKADPWDLPPGTTTELTNEIKAALRSQRVLSLYQSTGTRVDLWPSTVDAATYLTGGVTLDPVAFSGKAALDLAPLQSGGFGSWYLASQDAMKFSGTISATVNNQLRLDANSFSATTDASRLTLKAAAAQIGSFSSSGAPAAAGIGAAEAKIEARDIGLVGAFSWNGFGTSEFISSGELHFDSVGNSAALRTGGRLFNGQMNASGSLELSGARLSPATYSDFRVDLLADPAGRIKITRPANATADVSLSPAGRIEFAAKTIDHQGTVTAPLGEIVFNAPSGSVTLGSGSMTSVAADRDLLFGNTVESGTEWNYQGVSWQQSASSPGASPYTILTAPAKSIRIDAAQSTVASGATLDLSGGGEALAWEFTAGPGGKTDVLNASAATTFAILPNWNGFSATDSQLQQYYNVTAVGSAYSAVPSLKVGDRIALTANQAGLDGSYVLLPARYAILPGAFLVSVKTSSDSVLSGAKPQADGSWLVAGTRLAVNVDGGTTAYSQRPLTLELASSNVTAKRARYITTTASEFFYDTAGAKLAGDAGQLTAIGRNTLVFDPAIVAMRQAEIAAGDGRTRAGRGLELDLAAPKLLITDAGTAPDATWSLLDQNKLNALGASSLLLGGVRTTDGATTRIETIASQVQVRNTGVANAGQALAGPELMLTAKDQLAVLAGTRIEASGGGDADRSVVLNGDGAFLRAAAGSQATVTREGTVSRAQGDLVLTTGATVAGQSLVFDATLGNTLLGTVALGTLQDDGTRRGGYLAVGAGRINVVGDGTVPADGLTLDNTDLARFAKADQLRLTSYTTLDLYGDAVLGTADLKELVIDAAGIAGHGGATQTANIAAKNVMFENRNPASAIFTAGAGLGLGALKVTAGAIVEPKKPGDPPTLIPGVIRFGANASVADRTAETTGFAIRGFADNPARGPNSPTAAVNLTAIGDLRFEGRGVTAIDNVGGSGTATLAINAARVVTVGTADHLLTASGGGSIAASAGAAGGSTGLGGALELRAKSINVTGRVEATAGKLTLAATGADAGTGHVTLGSGAVVAAEGVKVAFADTAAYAPGGQVVLRSAKGNVDVQDGAEVSVSAAAEGGDAGRLRLEAQEGTVSAAANTLRGNASAADSGARQGELTVDAKAVELDALAAAVRQPDALTHFTGAWDVRRRVGDLTLSKEVKARSVKFAADIGDIDIQATGLIDASGSKGGTIQLYANRGKVIATDPAASGGRIDLRAGSVLRANATEVVGGGQGTAGRGGTVTIGVSATSAADELGTAIGFEAASGGREAALIDVATAPGSSAAAGKVTFRAPRKDVVSPLVAANGALIVGNDALTVPLPTGYTIAPAAAVSSLLWGTTVSVRLPDNNSGQVTLNLSQLGSKNVVRADGSLLADGDLVSATAGKVLVFDGSTFRISPTANAGIPATPGNSAGTNSAYTLGGTSPASWGLVAFRAHLASAASPTLKIGTAPARPLLNSNGTPLAAGAIALNQLVLAVYDGTNFRVSPTTPTIARAMNTAPGTSGVNFQVAETSAAAALVPGTVVSFIAQAAAKLNANLRVDGNALKPLLGADGSPIAANAFLAQQGVVAVYDGAAFRIATTTFADTGTVINNYRLPQAQTAPTAADLKISGYTVNFLAKTTNTGASKLAFTNANGTTTILNVDLKREDGAALQADDIRANRLVTAVYTVTDAVAGTGEFRLVAGAELATGPLATSTMAPVSLAGNVNGAATIALEGVRTSRNTGDLVLGAQQQALLLGGTAQAAAKAADFLGDADADGRLGAVFLAGEEVRATGTITINSDWNLATARYANQPGALTLRAEGDLNVNGTLTDGFVANGSNTAVSRDARLAASGTSWSYRLVAGADTAAASPLATKATAATGNIVLAANKLVRTGTGSIDLAARRDIKLLDRAAIFTAGTAASSHPSGFAPITSGTDQRNIYSAFPDGGGDLSLTAGERIVMTKATTAVATETTPDLRHINQWLLRSVPGRDLQWWPRIASFQQGVAAFGGGDIALAAGTEIRNFAAFIPTNGRVPTIDGQRLPDLAVVQGGGDLTVGAGGTVTGGMFYAETGRLQIEAAALASSVHIAVGNTAARVRATGNVALGNVFNPMSAPQRAVVNFGTTVVNFPDTSTSLDGMRIGTYGPASSFDVVSVAGNLALNGDSSVFSVSDTTQSLAPSRFKAVALNGDISGGVMQAPGESGQLDLLAAGSINFSSGVAKQLDVPAAALPSLRNPMAATNFDLAGVLDFNGGTPIEIHSSTGWHGADSEPSRLIALAGNITGARSESTFAVFNEQVRIEAGGNITDLSVIAQHARSSDVSIVAAGNNIKYNLNAARGIALGGSGRLEVTAGGSIDFGDSQGIVTRGNLDNPYLPEVGASIFALAGATPDYTAFRNYLKVGNEVTDLMLRDRFYTLLRDSGRAAEAGGGEASYEKGRAAIGALFPQANIKGGDINLFASQIKTEQGGGIDLLAPGGSIVVGVLDPTIKKKPAVQGLFTLRDGDIRAYVKNNFLVNQSRVFTLDGGNILVWADQGSIDAGSGAKTVSSTPPPALVIRNGQIVLDTSNSVSGSGIGVLASRDDTPTSDMDLFAPQGAIDAGDAGLRSTGNITLGARTILNASNIQAGGAVAGAPAPVAAPAPAAAPASPTGNDKGDAAAATAATGNRDARQGILTVEVLGGEDDPEAKKRKKDEDS